MDRAAVERWVANYECLWRTAGTAELAELFRDDATYSTAPYEQPYNGLEAIRRVGPVAGALPHFEEWPFAPPAQSQPHWVSGPG